MQLIGTQRIWRRITRCAILLFCSSLALGQARVDQSIFRTHDHAEEMPSFVLNLRHSTGTSVDLRGGGSTPFLALQTMESDRPVANDSSSMAVAATRAAEADTTKAGKSPGLAMLMSMIVPGSGQIYVHRYITIPIIWGFGIYFAKAWNDQNNRYIYYRDLFTASVKADSTGNGDGQYQSIRDFYRDDRDKFAFYLAITYVLNIIDAYVGASLYSFDVSDNLGGSAALRLRIPIR